MNKEAVIYFKRVLDECAYHIDVLHNYDNIDVQEPKNMLVYNEMIAQSIAIEGKELLKLPLNKF